MTASWFVYFLPYAALARAFDQTANAYDALIIATSAGASIWVSLVLLISRRLEVRREVGMLHYARPLASALAPRNPGLRRLLERARIELYVLGDPDRVVDPGGRVTASPRVFPMYGEEKTRYAVMIPALALTRLHNDAEALDAVLAHEAAHVLHRDLRLLAGFANFLRVTLWFVPVAVAITIGTSVITDIRAGADAGSSILAGVLGKSSVVVLPLLILVSIAMLQFAEAYREALADAFAVETVGASGLARAERVLSVDDHDARSWGKFGSTEVLYSWRLIAMYGFAIGATDGYLPSPLAYWHGTLLGESPLRLPLSVAFSAISVLILYGGAYGLAYILTSERLKSWITTDFITKRLALFAFCAIIGGVVTQTLPLMLSAAPIFDRFPNISRHDALPLLLANFTDSGTTIVACTLVAALCAMATRAGRWQLWFVLGGIVLLVGQVEPMLAPQYTLGLAAFVIGTILMAPPAWRAIKSRKDAGTVTAVGTVVAALVIIGSWFGLGGPGCLAVSLEAASEAASKRGDAERAISLARQATWYASLNATGFLELARLQLASNSSVPDAIKSSEWALRAPYLHDWSEHFNSLVTAATAHLERRNASDWTRARDLLSTARDMWERNTRLDAQNGVILQYNSAVMSCHDGADPLTALIYVVTALGYVADDARAASVAHTAIDDPDLACMSLSDIVDPKPSTVQLFRNARGTTKEVIGTALARGLDPQEAMRFLRFLIRARAGS
jgi:hypothetical protein